MKNSHIQWTDNTFNPWEGCTKVSPGCANCYAEARNARFGGGKAPNWGPGAPRRRTSESNWREPVRWNAAAQKLLQAFNAEEPLTGMQGLNRRPPQRPRVFSASLADWLDEEVHIALLADFLTLVFDCGFLDWQLLTKRPRNFQSRVAYAGVWIANNEERNGRNAEIVAWIEAWCQGAPPHNVWVGTTVEDQERADERIPLLLEIPAVVHFLSIEPILGKVRLPFGCARDYNKDGNCDRHPVRCPKIDWVIVGGESGNKARATSLDAIEEVIWQCREAKVACFVKQLGAKPRIPEGSLDLRHSKGGDPAEWPERFQVQEFPEVTP